MLTSSQLQAALGQMPLSNHHLINIDEVKSHVETALQQRFTWFYSQETGSTNSDLLQQQQPLSIAITENQHQGRGQRASTWHASNADNLLFSLALEIKPHDALTLIPLKVGIAIKTALNQLGFDNISLKWPNDIFYHHKKLGGILIESITQEKRVLVVIGVGININMPYTRDDSFISLKQQQTIDRSPLLSQCLIAIYKAITSNKTNTIDAFNSAHMFHHKTIHFKGSHNISTGICQGINDYGQLLIETKHGLEAHSNGSIVMNHYVVS